MAIEQDGAIKGQQGLWALAACAPLPLHLLSIKPQEDEAIQQRIPVGGLEAIVERWGKSRRRYRPLLPYQHSFRHAHIVRSVAAKSSCTLGVGDARCIDQALGAHQAVFKNRRGLGAS